MTINDFMTIEQLATFTGSVMVVFILVQTLKDLKPLKQIPTKYLSILIGILNVIMIAIMQGKFNISQLYIMLINGVFVGLTAISAHDFPNKTIKSNVEPTVLNNTYVAPLNEPIKDDIVNNIETDTREFDNLIPNDSETENIQSDLVKENNEIKG